jgi:hypothetical protein
MKRLLQVLIVCLIHPEQTKSPPWKNIFTGAS